MNERNLNEGQWEDRKQWSLGVGQRRKMHGTDKSSDRDLLSICRGLQLNMEHRPAAFVGYQAGRCRVLET